MNDKNTGGPAFPTSHSANYPEEIVGGMTLRDYFAGQYLMGYMAGQASHPTREDAAREAYLMSDAMLKAREA